MPIIIEDYSAMYVFRQEDITVRMYSGRRISQYVWQKSRRNHIIHNSSTNDSIR
jgi:hypothetical protein